MVSIAAFQAVDPGSIPGQRKVHFAQSISHPFFPPPYSFYTNIVYTIISYCQLFMVNKKNFSALNWVSRLDTCAVRGH